MVATVSKSFYEQPWTCCWPHWCWPLNAKLMLCLWPTGYRTWVLTSHWISALGATVSLQEKVPHHASSSLNHPLSVVWQQQSSDRSRVGRTLVAASTLASSFSNSATTSTWPSLEARWRAFNPFWKKWQKVFIYIYGTHTFSVKQTDCAHGVRLFRWGAAVPFKSIQMSDLCCGLVK